MAANTFRLITIPMPRFPKELKELVLLLTQRADTRACGAFGTACMTPAGIARALPVVESLTQLVDALMSVDEEPEDSAPVKSPPDLADVARPLFLARSALCDALRAFHAAGGSKDDLEAALEEW